MIRQLIGLLMLVPLAATATAPDWTLYDELLVKYVTAGTRDGVEFNLVDYEGLADDPKFDSLVRGIRAFDPGRLEGTAEKLAFYINAYNILTIQLILDHWPVTSIKEIGGFFKGPWDVVMLENRDGSLTLDNIEHDIIRSLDEPRIHFAVNCASLSCPDLRREAYRAARLDAQLDDQSREFLAQEGKGILVDGTTVRVSSIFDWYEEDFEQRGGVRSFVQHYRPDLDIERVRANIPYDWSLNSKEKVTIAF